MQTQTNNIESGAIFSPCRDYRYRLWRTWDLDLPSICFIMLNPSTANETKNDPTVSRCEERARRMGYGTLLVANLFALRSTDPKALYRHTAPVGRDNDDHITVLAKASSMVICAWSQHGKLNDRANAVIDLLERNSITCHALRINQDGSPAHPLYLPYSLKPQLMRSENPDKTEKI